MISKVITNAQDMTNRPGKQTARLTAGQRETCSQHV